MGAVRQALPIPQRVMAVVLSVLLVLTCWNSYSIMPPGRATLRPIPCCCRSSCITR